MQQPTRISPSILASDFAQLGAEVKAISDAGADLIHVDVMDGHFVPNLTIGPGVVKAIKPYTSKPLDVHLMIQPADPMIDEFVKAGADYLTVHIEAGPHAHRSLQAIKSHGIKAGISLCPATPANQIAYLMDLVDLVLVMSVNPGFGGQAFIESQLDKVKEIREMIDASGRMIDLEIDGGINEKTARLAVQAGADMLVAGTAVFKGGPEKYAENIALIRGDA